MKRLAPAAAALAVLLSVPSPAPAAPAKPGAKSPKAEAPPKPRPARDERAGTVISVDSEEELLTVKDDEGKTWFFGVDERSRLTREGWEKPIEVPSIRRGERVRFSLAADGETARTLHVLTPGAKPGKAAGKKPRKPFAPASLPGEKRPGSPAPASEVEQEPLPEPDETETGRGGVYVDEGDPAPAGAETAAPEPPPAPEPEPEYGPESGPDAGEAPEPMVEDDGGEPPPDDEDI